MKENIIYYSKSALMIACFLVFIIGFQSFIEEPIFNIVFSDSDSLWVCALGVLSLLALGLKVSNRE